MNWKDVPHLFANGRFSYVKKGHASKITSFYDLRNKFDNSEAIGFNNFTRLNEIESLIARKIEDMTDEEKIRRQELSMYDEDNYPIESPESFLYLLSIGVYPFDQKHFEDGTVIDSATL